MRFFRVFDEDVEFVQQVTGKELSFKDALRKFIQIYKDLYPSTPFYLPQMIRKEFQFLPRNAPKEA